jgi:hypothetical protein
MFLLYVGLYESVVIILFLTRLTLQQFGLCTGYNYDIFFSRRTNENLWLLNAVMVAQDIFSQAGWRLCNRILDA